MASNYTTNYGLCQWEPGDKFLREEFNQDNGKIDGAIKAVRDNAAADIKAVGDRAAAEHQEVRRRLETANYNLCNLLLQNDYEGKYTGFKRALLFDGFLNGDRIASLSGFIPGQNTLSLSRTGQGDITNPESMGSTSPLSTPGAVMTGSGTITGFRYTLYADNGISGLGTVNYTLTVNGTVRDSGTDTPKPPAGGEVAEREMTLRPTTAKKGDICVLRLESKTSGLRLKKGSNNTLAGTWRISSAAAATGTMTAKAAGLPAAAGAAAWVRHRGGTVGLSIQKGGQKLAFTRGETVSSAELLTQAACQETAFMLEQPLDAGDWQVVLTGAIGDGETEMDIFDYGVVLLP